MPPKFFQEKKKLTIEKDTMRVYVTSFFHFVEWSVCWELLLYSPTVPVHYMELVDGELMVHVVEETMVEETMLLVHS